VTRSWSRSARPFGRLARALELLGPLADIEVRALTDLGALFTIAQLGADEHGCPG
jgi:hypothetical protein